MAKKEWTWRGRVIADHYSHDLEEYLDIIREQIKKKDKQIEFLHEEVRKLKEEYSKDEEIQKMQAHVDRLQKECRLGFPISEKEHEAIEEWKKKHDKEVHGLTTDNERMRAGGAIGGRFQYSFVPTSIGIIGTVKCDCGAEFVFQDI